MSAKRPSVYFVAVLLMYSVFTVSTSWIATLNVDGKSPTVPAMKIINNKKNVDKCAIECAKAKNCYSFAFGSNQCMLWDARYLAEDKIWKGNMYEIIMKNKTGYVYYHLTQQPEATELKVSDGIATFKDAYKECQNLYRGNLVSINDMNMLEKVKKLMAENGKSQIFWIGLNGTVDGTDPNKAALTFDLRWADGNVYTAGRFNNFIAMDPNMPSTSCVLIHKTGFTVKPYGWADDKCENSYYYICQYALSP